MTLRTALPITAALLVLAACDGDAAPEDAPAETGGEVAGDVLEGTISDDMLPFEDLTSSSPPAEGTGDEEGADAENDET